MNETFWTLLQDKAHWEFEIFLMVLFDLFLGGMLWPFISKHWQHHLKRDRRELMEERMREYLKKYMGYKEKI